MITEKKITVDAKTYVDDTPICSWIAVLKPEINDVSFLTRQLDKLACKEHRDIVRADQAAFEDEVYDLMDVLYMSYD